MALANVEESNEHPRKLRTEERSPAHGVPTGLMVGLDLDLYCYY
jgi:hypothetical protein